MKVQSPSDLGALVREERRRQRLSQSEVALAANTGVRFVSDLENGKPTTQLAETLRVLQALGLDLVLVGRGR